MQGRRLNRSLGSVCSTTDYARSLFLIVLEDLRSTQRF